MVQWLRLHASTPGGTGSFPDWRRKILHTVGPKKIERKKKKKVLVSWPQQDTSCPLPHSDLTHLNSPCYNLQVSRFRFKAREFEKNIYFCFIDYTKAFDCVDHSKLENSSRDGNTRPCYLTPENLYTGQEATVRTGHRTTDWFQIGKGMCQICMLSPCLFNLYAEYIMRNAGLGEAQAGIKIARRNINNLRYADDTTLTAESKELKSLLMKVKEENKKDGLKLNIQKTKIMASSPIT